MKRVYYDPEARSVVVDASATVGETFRALFEHWAVVIPLGEYRGSGWVGTWPVALSGSCADSWAWQQTICTRSNW